MPNDLWVPRLNGEVLRRARTSEGITLRELAARCRSLGMKVDHSNLSKAERLGRSLGPRRLAFIFLALPGIKPAELIQDYTPDRQAHMEALIKKARDQAAAEAADGNGASAGAAA